MWRRAVQENEPSDWEQQDLKVQVDLNLQKAYRIDPSDALPEPLQRLLDQLRTRAGT